MCQPQPAASASSTIVIPSTWPSSVPSSCSIRSVTEASTAGSAPAAIQIAFATSKAGSASDAVSAGALPGPSAVAFSWRSLSTIVPVAVLRAMVGPPVGFERTTFKVSSPSTSLSPVIDTVNVSVVVPGLKVSVPDLAV